MTPAVAHAETTEKRVRALFEASSGARRPVVVFGTGELGRRMLRWCRAAGLEVVAAADNNRARWDEKLDGVTVLPPLEAVRRFGDRAVFIVAVYNASAPVDQLRLAGVDAIATFPEFFLRFAEFVPGMSGLATPEFLSSHEADIRSAFELLDDAPSRREYAAQIEWRSTLDDRSLDRPSPFADMHFDRSVYTISESETLVDCGAYDGDSLRTFLKHTAGKFEHAYALEPDPANRAALERCVAGLPEADGSVTVLPYAASDRDGTLRFGAGHGVESASSESGELEVCARTLDGAIEGAPTLVKMDIEGAELAALRGAARLIREHRPVLAICAYHYCEHLWQLPHLLHELAPDFRIFLRRYAEQCWETVYYAVPPERCAIP